MRKNIFILILVGNHCFSSKEIPQIMSELWALLLDNIFMLMFPFWYISLSGCASSNIDRVYDKLISPILNKIFIY